MLKLILKQANWGALGTVFAFSIGFFVKIYLIDIVKLHEWGKYSAAQTFSSFAETILSIGIPLVIIRFFPAFIERNKAKASRVANIFLKYSLIVGLGFLLIIYLGLDYIDHVVYKEIDDLGLILFFMCIHVPISMLFGVVISLYRSVFKIKEIVLYGTVISVSLRAVLTFIIFQFTDNISHFILIEIFTQIIVLSILLYLFNKNECSLFVKSDLKEVTRDIKMLDYGQKMFLNSIISFFSGYALSIVITFTLSPADIGAYNILLTLTGLTTFLLINLNKVFAPAISKLYSENKIIELNALYKKTTFLINILTIPLIVVIAIFADEILGLYTAEMQEYKDYLFLMIVGGMLSLAAGSSGTFMIMAGLEKQDLYIQFIRGFFLFVLSFFLINYFSVSSGMLVIVVLYVVFMLFVNVSQLIYIKRYINISPFSKDLILLFLVTFIGMYIAINQEYIFDLVHFFLIPIGVYLGYFLLLFNPIRSLIRELR